MVRLRARSIGSTAASILRGAPAPHRVVAAFARSCYLEVGGRIVAVVLPDLLNGPLNVVVSAPKVAAFDRPAPAAIDLDLRGAAVWPARLPPFTDEEIAPASDRVAAVERALAHAPRESLARAEGRPHRAAEAMSHLADGLRRGEVEAVADAAARLAGLGPGLTPSGDDLLVGVMVALTLLAGASAGPASPEVPRSAMRRVIYETAASRTTRVSAAYLEAASRGEAGEAWHRLRAALAAGGGEAVERAARRVLAFGETSGADMLAGFALALRALAGPAGP